METIIMKSMNLGVNYSSTTAYGTLSSEKGTSEPQTSIPSQTNLPIQSPLQQMDSGKDISKEKKELSANEAQQVTVEMNKFMELLNTDIKFMLHEKTKTLIVQVVDKDNKVLKEFPAHEMLDIKAKIREHIGILLDHRV